MSEFFYNLVHPLPNAVMSVIMAILLLYWLFAFFSGAGFEDMDFDVDFDADVDVDIDVDVDAHVEVNADTDTDIDTAEPDRPISTEKSHGFFIRLLQFINIGKVPFMLVFTILNMFIWLGSLITTKIIDLTSWEARSLLILIPLFLLSIFLTKLATMPLARLFKAVGYKGEQEIDFFGRAGKMLSNINGNKIGFAEFVIDSNPIKLNVISMEGEELKYGDKVIIADETKDKKIYYVIKS